MYALEVSSGELRWLFDVSDDGASQFHGNPLVVDSLIFFGTDEGSKGIGTFYCLNRISGNLVWKNLGHSGVGSDPAFSGDSLVYVVTRDDSLLAVSINSGEIKWSFFTGWQRPEMSDYARDVDIPRIVSSPLVLNDAVVIAGRDSTVYSLAKKTGVQNWSTPLGAINSSELLALSGDLILGLSDYTLIAIDVESGEVVRKDTLEFLAYGGMAQADGGLYFLEAHDDLHPTEVAAFDLQNKTHRWTATIPDYDTDIYWYVPRIHLWKDEMVVGSAGGRVVGCDRHSGKWNWQTNLRAPIRGIGHSDSLLFVGTFDGDLYALRIASKR